MRRRAFALDGGRGGMVRAAASGDALDMRANRGSSGRARIDSALIVSIAWEESRFRWVTSDAGAAGPLQALPSLWCDGGTEHGCDLIAAGLDAFQAWSSRFAGRRWETVCSYNGGNRCGVRAIAYADRVLDRYHDLLAELSAPAGCPGC